MRVQRRRREHARVARTRTVIRAADARGMNFESMNVCQFEKFTGARDRNNLKLEETNTTSVRPCFLAVEKKIAVFTDRAAKPLKSTRARNFPVFSALVSSVTLHYASPLLSTHCFTILQYFFIVYP